MVCNFLPFLFWLFLLCLSSTRNISSQSKAETWANRPLGSNGKSRWIMRIVACEQALHLGDNVKSRRARGTRGYDRIGELACRLCELRSNSFSTQTLIALETCISRYFVINQVMWLRIQRGSGCLYSHPMSTDQSPSSLLFTWTKFCSLLGLVVHNRWKEVFWTQTSGIKSTS